MRWLWAAYQSGVWKEILVEGLSQQEFSETVTDMLGMVDHDWIVEIKTDKGLRPVGLITGDNRFMGHGIEPHVDWFPWATPRNKLECAIQFIKQTGKETKLFLYIREDLKFWERVWRYKVLKKGCKINDCYGSGEDAVMYYSPGPFK